MTRESSLYSSCLGERELTYITNHMFHSQNLKSCDIHIVSLSSDFISSFPFDSRLNCAYLARMAVTCAWGVRQDRTSVPSKTTYDETFFDCVFRNQTCDGIRRRMKLSHAVFSRRSIMQMSPDPSNTTHQDLQLETAHTPKTQLTVVG